MKNIVELIETEFIPDLVRAFKISQKSLLIHISIDMYKIEWKIAYSFLLISRYCKLIKQIAIAICFSFSVLAIGYWV